MHPSTNGLQEILLMLSPTIVIVIGQIVVGLIPRNTYTRLGVYACLAWILSAAFLSSVLWLTPILVARYPPELKGLDLGSLSFVYIPLLGGLLAAVVTLLCWGMAALGLFLRENTEARHAETRQLIAKRGDT